MRFNYFLIWITFCGLLINALFATSVYRAEFNDGSAFMMEILDVNSTSYLGFINSRSLQYIIYFPLKFLAFVPKVDSNFTLIRVLANFWIIIVPTLLFALYCFLLLKLELQRLIPAFVMFVATFFLAGAAFHVSLVPESAILALIFFTLGSSRGLKSSYLLFWPMLLISITFALGYEPMLVVSFLALARWIWQANLLLKGKEKLGVQFVTYGIASAVVSCLSFKRIFLENLFYGAVDSIKELGIWSHKLIIATIALSVVAFLLNYQVRNSKAKFVLVLIYAAVLSLGFSILFKNLNFEFFWIYHVTIRFKLIAILAFFLICLGLIPKDDMKTNDRFSQAISLLCMLFFLNFDFLSSLTYDEKNIKTELLSQSLPRGCNLMSTDDYFGFQEVLISQKTFKPTKFAFFSTGAPATESDCDFKSQREHKNSFQHYLSRRKANGGFDFSDVDPVIHRIEK